MAPASKPFPLMKLPYDIRLKILDYVLPRPEDGSAAIDLRIHGADEESKDKESKDQSVVLTSRVEEPSCLSLRRYLKGIGMVNRQLHDDALRLLYSRTFVLCISEWTFRDQLTSSNYLTYPHDSGVEWRWDQFTQGLPGLDWSRVKKLRVRLGDSDYPGYWENAWTCLKSLSDLRHGVFKNVKRLEIDVATIQVHDMEWERYDGFFRPFEPWSTTAEHIGGCLVQFLEGWRGITRCDIKVPEWALSDEYIQLGVRETKQAVMLEPAAFEDVRLDQQLFNILIDSPPESPEDKRLDPQLFNLLIDEVPEPGPWDHRSQQYLGLWDKHEEFPIPNEEFDDWYLTEPARSASLVSDTERIIDVTWDLPSWTISP